MKEIERKFLVKSDAFKNAAHTHHHIVQGYLNSHPERTVRLRVKGESAFLTIKGKSNATGTTRLEWETELSLTEARPLMALCEPGMIDKIRYEIKVGRHTYEVDVFAGENQGLVLAEIELSHEDEEYEKPEWLGMEVTADHRYSNSYLSKHPYSKW